MISAKVETQTVLGKATKRRRNGIAKFFYRLSRFLFWCAVNFAVWPAMRPFAKRFRLVDFIFVVYPGSKQDINAYVPLWFQWIFKNIFRISVIGKVSTGKYGKRGLIVTLSKSPEGFTKEELKEVLARIEKLAKATGATYVALAGRIPSICLSKSIPLEFPFLKGDRGAIFTVTETVWNVLAREGISPQERIGVLGVGFLGGKILSNLRKEGCTSLVGFDPRIEAHTSNDGLILTNDLTLLGNCKVVIVLTAKGEDIASAVPHLRQGVIVIDDTHPPLPSVLTGRIRQGGGKVYKAAQTLEGVDFFPTIPGYQKGAIPGCVIEALVGCRGSSTLSQLQFNQEGRKLGLRPFAISPEGDE